MRSFIVAEMDAKNADRYSELKVMHSPAGYYIGTSYKGDHITEPGSRDSHYFDSREQATAYLTMVEASPNPEQFLRTHP